MWLAVVVASGVLGCSSGSSIEGSPGSSHPTGPWLAVDSGAVDGGGGSKDAGTNDAGSRENDSAVAPSPAPDGATSGCTGTMCGGSCVMTSSDPANCGVCGNACAGFQKCVAGVCTGGSACPPPPAGVSAGAAAAYMTENGARAAAGIPCATMQPALDTSAADHCGYYAANTSNASCIADPHVEVSSCSMYVAAQFYDRESAAGYTGQPAFEDMAFQGNGAAATQQWIDSIWHRIPILSPWVADFGYGGAAGCDTMDFGVGNPAPASTTATYPYAGQTQVPTSFDGSTEGPPPPAPPSGWPSGYPITVYLQGAMTPSVHTITVLGSTTPLQHQMISPGDADAMGLLTDEVILYTNAPLSSGTQYHVHVEASNSGPVVTFDWTFTTM
jgi:hypothetical protein